ncbi:MAG: hypothetical protein A3C47_01380 [Omnitrophica bacterium RIFCSPHIGHO2_02_FULL_51_18]|nr:MAG: hypothetical protein A3C47_01380 [Omnitrophica bacterium RIFCSPHIGHO2_02_FULL_51_18]
MVLLDTHIWIWLINGDKKLSSPNFLRLIDRLSANSGIRVSIISVWEVGMLEHKGRIDLPYSCLEWVHRALHAPGISLVPLTPEIAIESCQLGKEFGGDPADRILVATAKSIGATLVTEDEHILNHSKKNLLDAASAHSFR